MSPLHRWGQVQSGAVIGLRSLSKGVDWSQNLESGSVAPVKLLVTICTVAPSDENQEEKRGTRVRCCKCS